MPNKESTSNYIPIELMLQSSGKNPQEINALMQMLGRLIESAAIKLGIQTDPKAYQTIEGLNNLIKDLGINIKKTGNEYQVMMKNAAGMGISLLSSFTGFKQGRDAQGRFTGKLVAESSEGEATYTSNRLTSVQNLITAYENLAQAQARVADMERQGWNQEQGNARAEAYRLAQEQVEKYTQQVRDADSAVEKLGATENSQLYLAQEHQQQKAQLAEQSRQASLEQQQENQAVQQYLSLTQQIWQVETQLAAAKSQGTNASYISALENERSVLTSQRAELERVVQGTHAFANAQDELARINAKGQANLAKYNSTLKNTGSVFNNIKSMLTNVVVYGTAYKALYAVMNGFKETINIVKELDKSLVDLQIATGKTRQEASQMLDTYNQMAQTLGATTKQVADSATTWLRQGYSEADTNKLIYDSMVLSKVGMIESAEATKYLTSAMKGYQVSVDDAMSIVDKLSKIDLNAVTIIFLYDYRCAYCESSM